MKKTNFVELVDKDAMARKAADLLEQVKRLRQGVIDNVAKGEYMAEINLQKQLLAGVKSGKVSLNATDAAYLYEVTKKCFKGRNVPHAVSHLDALFKLPALAKSSGGGDVVKANEAAKDAVKVAANVAAPKAPTVQPAPAVAVTAKPAPVSASAPVSAAPLVARPVAITPAGNVSASMTKS